MRLVIDIGNTRAKLVVFDGTEMVGQTYSDSCTLSGLDDLLARHTFRKGILGTVATLGTEAERRLRELPFPLVRLEAGTPLPFPLAWRRLGSRKVTPLPPTLGADRIAAIVGAMVQRPGTPLLIIDSGTCITYEVVDEEGYYLGGNIAPGLQMRLKAMHEHTALLPEVPEEGDSPLLGYDTETCMRSGVLQGLQYEIEGYIKSMRAKYPKLLVFLTGGDKINFDSKIKNIIFADKYIVPRGLNKILDYNYGKIL